MNGSAALVETTCKNRAQTSLPVPVSPVNKMGNDREARRRSSASILHIDGETPRAPCAPSRTRSDMTSRTF